MKAPFKKVRNKFLFLNLTITTIIMLIAFFSIYITFEMSLQNENRQFLDYLLEAEVANHHHLPFHAHYFSAILDLEGNILSIHRLDDGFLDLSSEIELDWLFHDPSHYMGLVQAAWEQPFEETIYLEGSHWMVTSFRDVDHYQFEFLDITPTMNTLRSLLVTFLFVGVFSFIAIFLLSTYYANRSMKPIINMWESQKKFISNASHELKTPLSTIIASYDVLMMTPDETIGSQEEWFSYMKLGTTRMTKLVNNLLTLVKLEESEIQPRRVDFDVSHLAQQVADLMEARAMQKQITFTKLIDEGIYLNGNEALATTIFETLLENAMKYVDDGGTVILSLKQHEAQQVIFTVANSGTGIKEEHLPHIFDRFYRGDESRTSEEGDFGLGLSIVKSALEQINGKIHVTSEVGKLTTFTVTLSKLKKEKSFSKT